MPWHLSDADRQSKPASPADVIPTPALDRIAQNGLRYTNFPSTSLCSPTRAVLLLDVKDSDRDPYERQLNLANPVAAIRWWRLPADGVGLARTEFVVGNHIKVHPTALMSCDELNNVDDRRAIADLTAGCADRRDYFVDRLSCGLARIAATHYPRPVFVRTSDSKTDKYANLMGGAQFKRKGRTQCLGSAAPRVTTRPAPAAKASPWSAMPLRRLRDEMDFDNVIIMIPFCRSLKEADRVLEVMAENGLKRRENGLQVYVMCEILSNVILAKGFAERFDGFSIGSNDLTQPTLGVDRDSQELVGLFDEQDEAVKWMIRCVFEEAHKAGAKVGLCGQVPSDHPELAEYLVGCGIDSISVSPDSFLAVKRSVAAAEAAAPASCKGTTSPVLVSFVLIETDAPRLTSNLRRNRTADDGVIIAPQQGQCREDARIIEVAPDFAAGVRFAATIPSKCGSCPGGIEPRSSIATAPSLPPWLAAGPRPPEPRVRA